MLQRIQTVYLLIVVALIVATLFLPLATIQIEDVFYSYNASGISTMNGEPELVYPAWGLFALTAIIALIALCSIFMFKKRVVQIRLCIFNMLLMLGFYGIFVYIAYVVLGQVETSELIIKIPLSFPLIGLILTYLAIRNIGADEALVRSLERLR